MTSNFSKRDTSIMKGFAIICIVFHNYFRWLYPSPGENEFNCSPGNVDRLFEMLGQQPGEFINLLFSYFGHVDDAATRGVGFFYAPSDEKTLSFVADGHRVLHFWQDRDGEQDAQQLGSQGDRLEAVAGSHPIS